MIKLKVLDINLAWTPSVPLRVSPPAVMKLLEQLRFAGGNKPRTDSHIKLGIGLF